MKKYCLRMLFIAGCCVAFSLNVKAQVDSVKASKLKAQLVDTICTCVSQTDLSTVKTEEDIQTLMMKCFMGNGMGIFMDYATAAGIDFTNVDQMKEMGMQIGMTLTTKCPAFMKVAMKIAVSDSSQMKQMMQQYNNTETMPAQPKPAVPQKN
jgi:hypothetical protein